MSSALLPTLARGRCDVNCLLSEEDDRIGQLVGEKPQLDDCRLAEDPFRVRVPVNDTHSVRTAPDALPILLQLPCHVSTRSPSCITSHLPAVVQLLHTIVEHFNVELQRSHG